MNVENAHQLPPGWEKSTVGEIFTVMGGGTPSTAVAEYWNGDTPWATSADINDDHTISPRRRVTINAIERSATNCVPKGSVITATRVGLGKVGLTSTDLCFSQDCHGLVFNTDCFVPRYVLYQLGISASGFRHISRGTTINGITKLQLLGIPFLLPPLPEQHRIVEEIEKQFSRLDDGVANLQRVKANLKRYRASVLQAACEGRLVPTEAELAQQDGREYEPADELLKRILVERRRKWEENELAKMRAKGKEPADDKWKSRYKEPVEPNLSGLPELPEGWCWTSLGQAFNVYVGATPSRAKPEYWNGDIPWVSSGEVAFCRIRHTREHITEAGLASSSTAVHPPGTVLLGMIGEGKTRGQCAILAIAACNNQNSAAIRVSESGLPTEYVYRYLEGQYARTRQLGSGNNQPALNKSRVEEMLLPLPPLAEQHRIVAEVERRLSIIDQMETAVAANLKRVQRLRQAILKKAFEGKLVPQDPNDEPAGVLLERIRAERNVPRKTGKRTVVGTS